MDRYRFLKPEDNETSTKPQQKPKRVPRFFVTPAGKEEHTPYALPPKLRNDQDVNEITIPVEQQKSVTVALIGPPNVGKSSLLNKLIADKISATSSKAQTTRTQTIGCTTKEDTQIVFIDTPGIIEFSKQKSISRSLIISGWESLQEADLVLVMADASRNFDVGFYTNFYQVLDSLQKEVNEHPKAFETSLVLNKTDKILPKKKRETKLDAIISHVTSKYSYFRRTFPISVRAETNLEFVMDYIRSKAVHRAWEYHPMMTCYMSDYQRVMEVIREKIYRRLNKELPYVIEQRNVDWSDLGNGVTRVENYLYVESNSQKKIVIGAGGSTLKYICNEAQAALEEIFGRSFKIVLSVKIRSSSNSRHYISSSEVEGLLGYRLTPASPLSGLNPGDL